MLHGRSLRFAGTEARSLISDWARVGRSNRYRAAGTAWDLERALGALSVPITAVTFARDHFGPPAALQTLLRKMPHAPVDVQPLDDAQLGVRSDHFAWMKTPDAVAAVLKRTHCATVDDTGISQRD